MPALGPCGFLIWFGNTRAFGFFLAFNLVDDLTCLITGFSCVSVSAIAPLKLLELATCDWLDRPWLGVDLAIFVTVLLNRPCLLSYSSFYRFYLPPNVVPYYDLWRLFEESILFSTGL